MSQKIIFRASSPTGGRLTMKGELITEKGDICTVKCDLKGETYNVRPEDIMLDEGVFYE